MTIRIASEEEVALNKIVWGWDVRVLAGANNQARVDLLRGLYADGKVTDLMEVTPADASGIFRGCDGRTRYAALIANGTKTCTVAVLAPATDDEYIQYAYCCNSKGAQPPLLEDLKMTVDMLMARGIKEKAILTGPLSQVESKKRLKLACDQTRSNRNKQGVAKAKRMLMLETLPTSDPEERIKFAAAACDIKVSALKKALKLMPGKKKNSLLNEIKKDLGQANTTRRNWTQKKVLELHERYDNGYPTNEVFEVFDHIISQLSANLKGLQDERSRFEIRVNGGIKVKAAAAGKESR